MYTKHAAAVGRKEEEEVCGSADCKNCLWWTTPGKLAATVFAGGCNLRCPFCHNALLVTRLDESPALEEEEVLRFLESRRGLLDGVVLSGGEPLMQRDATDFLKRIRDLGFPVKVDTNGFFPAVLRRLLEEGLATISPWTSRTARISTGKL